ncbi:cation transporter [Priestia aryabhattai]|uniref:cation diffusion facilitator family transporter n=1 Tax=Bacillaceae TaxID=186817 RepID=UPI000BA0408B|nr:cation diffusion facilitator family transporter [Bacillus sp. CBEL-1]MBY6023475.1 cation diffusion facilitator family transporter [Nitratireductor sp. DP7N14-4]OZT12699.1 cation transporter [Priestia aryabhattai]TDB53843.1 cation transporter [Bacillus sp. CBEL-1]
MSHHHHHHHGHDHHGHHHFDRQREGNQKGLLIALCITAGIMILEFIGGLVTNSLALLSDSGHMLSDTSSLALSLVAIWFANRAASSEKTYGYYRFEVLAALFNGVTLFVIAGFIIYEAYERVLHPQTVASGMMMVIAAIGLGANLLSAWSLLRQGDVKDNVNLRSAYLHVLGDALGSVGALVAGLLMLLFNWYIADPIISVVVALLILKSAWGVLTHSVHILMEGSPAHVDTNEIKGLLKEIDGVKDVHDIHVWTITSGLHSFSCHLQVSDDQDCQAILQKALNLVKEQCGIEHSTIQVEKPGLEHGELKV